MTKEQQENKKELMTKETVDGHKRARQLTQGAQGGRLAGAGGRSRAKAAQYQGRNGRRAQESEAADTGSARAGGKRGI